MHIEWARPRQNRRNDFNGDRSRTMRSRSPRRSDYDSDRKRDNRNDSRSPRGNRSCSPSPLRSPRNRSVSPVRSPKMSDLEGSI